MVLDQSQPLRLSSQRYRHRRISEVARDDLQRRYAEPRDRRLDRAGVLSLAGALTYASFAAMCANAPAANTFSSATLTVLDSRFCSAGCGFLLPRRVLAALAVGFAIFLNVVADRRTRR